MTAHRTTTTRGRAGAGASERPVHADSGAGAVLEPCGADSGPESGAQTLVLPMFPDPKLARTLSANGRAHWAARAKAKDTVAGRVTLAAMLHGIRPMPGPVRIVFRWVFPRGGRHDVDNLIGSGVTKAAIDALVRAEYLPDDSSEYVASVAAEVAVERGRRALEITLAPVEER